MQVIYLNTSCYSRTIDAAMPKGSIEREAPEIISEVGMISMVGTCVVLVAVQSGYH